MYAHQVIESQKKILEAANKRQTLYNDVKLSLEDRAFIFSQEYYEYNIKKFCPYIFKAQKFHSDSYLSLSQKIPGLKVGTLAFHQDSQYLRLPYKYCWFDYVNDNKEPRLRQNQIIVTKRGLLVIEVKKNLLFIIIFNDVRNNKKLFPFISWAMNPIGYYISVGIHFYQRNDLEEIHRIMKPMFDIFYGNNVDMKMFGNVIFYPTTGNLTIKDIEIMKEEDSSDLQFLEMYLLLLNCKNIIKHEIPAPIKLNKKRKKQNKQELFSYHILKIKQNINKNSYSGEGNGGMKRLHLCRGHFKRRKTGIYWWQPHIRGRNKQGMVIKDYSLK